MKEKGEESGREEGTIELSHYSSVSKLTDVLRPDLEQSGLVELAERVFLLATFIEHQLVQRQPHLTFDL